MERTGFGSVSDVWKGLKGVGGSATWNLIGEDSAQAGGAGGERACQECVEQSQAAGAGQVEGKHRRTEAETRQAQAVWGSLGVMDKSLAVGPSHGEPLGAAQSGRNGPPRPVSLPHADFKFRGFPYHKGGTIWLEWLRIH